MARERGEMMELPQGFRFAGIHTGIKPDAARKDLALVVSDRPAAAAGVYTTNLVCAAPVKVCRRRTPSEKTRAIVINSGNANACTGDGGIKDAEEITAAVAESISAKPEEVLICSTGVIGHRLPMTPFRTGVPKLAAALRADGAGFEDAADAIMTTDTRRKTAVRTLDVGGKPVRIAGFCKGAAMIGPNMATMLAFVVTDLAAPAAALGPLLAAAVDKSFHCVGVEGHTSTNDTVLLLANGASGVPLASAPEFGKVLAEVCEELSRQIAEDAEGATKLVKIEVRGAVDEPGARKIARTIAESALVKTALFGNDPNWGRIVSAAGYAGVPFKEEETSLKV
ncbi:MAG TPA: bifunctional glutamate N-acetyltransferase/amino-acid acetyltransferase ArgJ, partial [Planctomycetia bacterium]|nr:bifunctional glutamate N-acetyltransferase/amino-acid acetyltransferase ArgJ [Planctomycetia bacterium]